MTRRRRRLTRACPLPFGARCRATPAMTADALRHRWTRAFPERAAQRAASADAPPRPRPRQAAPGGERGTRCRRRWAGRFRKVPPCAPPQPSRHRREDLPARCPAGRSHAPLIASAGGRAPLGRLPLSPDGSLYESDISRFLWKLDTKPHAGRSSHGRFRDLLMRFRPISTPGSAATGLPADRTAELAAELVARRPP